MIVQSSVPLQPLFTRPKGLWDQILEFVGFDHIDFESAQFSQRSSVKAPDKRWAYDVLHPRTREFLLSRPSFCIQFDEEHVKVWDRNRLAPWDVEQGLEVGVGSLERLPECVASREGSCGHNLLDCGCRDCLSLLGLALQRAGAAAAERQGELVGEWTGSSSAAATSSPTWWRR